MSLLSDEPRQGSTNCLQRNGGPTPKVIDVDTALHAPHGNLDMIKEKDYDVSEELANSVLPHAIGAEGEVGAERTGCIVQVLDRGDKMLTDDQHVILPSSWAIRVGEQDTLNSGPYFTEPDTIILPHENDEINEDSMCETSKSSSEDDDLYTTA